MFFPIFYINHHNTHMTVTSSLFTLLFQGFFKSFSKPSPSQLRIKTKTLFLSSSIPLQWINKKQMLFSSFANTWKKNVEQKVKLLKDHLQKCQSLKWLRGCNRR